MSFTSDETSSLSDQEKIVNTKKEPKNKKEENKSNLKILRDRQKEY